jgi:glyoxylase-like metal-dependent hydrolase (beta-lactamase superfamily II)
MSQAGIYRFKLGAFDVTTILDGSLERPPHPTFGANQSAEAVAELARSNGVSATAYDHVYVPTLVDTGRELVLFDTGNGKGRDPAVGKLPELMVQAGYKPGQVDVVVITHGHPDHINGLVTDGKPSYPNAEVMMPGPEWDFWMDDGNMSRAPEAMKGAFANVRRVFGIVGSKMTKYEPGKDVAPGIASMAAHGHSPGHTVHIVSSGNSRLMIQGDLTTLPQLFVRNPGWHVMFDMDASKAEETRRRVYDRVAADRIPVQGYHFPFPAVAHIEKTPSGYREIPVMWNPTL